MKKTILAAGGALAFALVLGAGSASAMSLPGSAATIAGAAQAQSAPEEVRWRRVCRNVRVWRFGRPVWVQQCRNVWVEPRRVWRNGRWVWY